MDVRLSPEQSALVDSVTHVVRDLGVEAVGQLDDAGRATKLEAVVAEAGWRELRTADADGTPWGSGVEVGLVAEELARGCADVAFLGPLIAADLRRRGGAPEAARPETVLVTADLGSLAAADDPGAIAIDADGAETAVGLVPTDGGWSLASIDLGAAETTTDLTRPVAKPIGDAKPMDGATNTLDAGDLDRVRALGLAITACDLVGVMQGATDLSTAYATERRQYGAPIGSFQAVQHMLADALVQTEGARSIARHAAWAVDALEPADALVAAAEAKAYAARGAREVCETAIQVHGGIGNTWECLAHVYLRRSLLSTDAFGGVGVCLEAVLAGRGLPTDSTTTQGSTAP